MKKEHIKDFYFYKAKRESYSARSVYKLKNINDKYHLFNRGNKVLDLGASPGSWTEYLMEVLGKPGQIIALDLKPLSMTCLNKIEKMGTEFLFLQQSVFDQLPSSIPQVDAVVSDLAPSTQGYKLVDQAGSLALITRAYEIAAVHLKTGGHYVVKLFHSEDTVALAKSWEKKFKLGKLYRPPATHKESKEIYFVGCHLKA